MNAQLADLLTQYGIPVNFTPTETKTETFMHPIRYEGDTAVFSSDQLDIFGEPDLYGYDNYIVIQSRNNLSPTELDWSSQQTYQGNQRPIHRYKRVERFEYVLAQLLGQRGQVPDEIFTLMANVDRDPNKCWDSARSLLKKHRLTRYYQRIPSILYKLGIGKTIDWDESQETYAEIIDEFKSMNYHFEKLNSTYGWNRKYFPNLRYIASKLLTKRGFKVNFKVNFIRTSRKNKRLAELWLDYQNKSFI